jgi:hypothetical protein
VGEALGAVLAAEAPRDLAVEFRGPQVALRLVIREGDVEVVHVAQDRLSVGVAKAVAGGTSGVRSSRACVPDAG